MDISHIISQIEKLHPIPVVIHKIITSLGDPDRPLSDLIRIVERDPAVSANLLKICNSAHFGLPGKIDSIQRAVTLLGVNRVAELVLSYGLSSNFNKALEGYCLAKGKLWKTSVACAMVARVLAQRRQLDHLPRIYTAALLKDIGKIVLHDFVAGAIGKIQSLVRNENLSFDEAERTCLGVDHAALGAMIARQWQFNPDMVSMIENHHLNNLKGRPEPSTAVIYWADMVSMMAESDFGVDRLAYRIYEDSFQELTLHKDEVRMLMQMYNGFLKGAERLFEIHHA